MNCKYYTPGIEEFYIGFEFEETPFIGGYKLTSNTIWHKVIYQITEKAPLSTIESMIHFKHARVKYLDKEDIESLGFKHLYDDFTFGKYFKSKCNIMNYNLNYDYSSNWLTISTVSKDDLIEYSTIFCGKILNKSEFKKLLIQLNIINE